MSDLAGELDRLDKAATPGPWEKADDYDTDDHGWEVDSGAGGMAIVVTPPRTGEPDAKLIVWLRNHTDEIKAALAVRPGMSQAVADLEERAVQAEAERDRLRVTVYGEVQQARDAAHAKHGDNGIGALPGDSARWLSILVEEVGEVAHELTYDSDGDLRKELIQVAAVATAWAAALAGDDGGDHRG